MSPVLPHRKPITHHTPKSSPQIQRPKKPLPSPPPPPPPAEPAQPANMSSSGRLDGGLCCSVCMEGYTEEERRPLMLPACGHTFCKQCMSTVMAREGERGTFLCPTCRRPQPVRAVVDLPVNYSLLEVARKEALSSGSSSATSSNSRHKEDVPKPGESCPEHGSRLAFWCVSCETAACGECLFDRHPRPTHDLIRLQDQLHTLQERTRIRAVRLVSQLISAAEENVAGVRAALVMVVEYLRQRKVLDDLARRARTAREAAKAARDYGDVTSVRDTIEAIQRNFEEAAITTTNRVCVSDPPSPSRSSSSSSPSSPSTSMGSSPVEDPHPTSVGDLHVSQETTLERSPPTNEPQVPDKHSVLSPASPPASATPLTSPPLPPATLAWSSPPRDAPNTPSPPLAAPPTWPPLLCGALSGNWTSSRISLEPRGLHVYALRPMKDKCDLFVNMGVVTGLVPLNAPEVFLELHDGNEALGRVYITLQSHLHRAQQFLTLCVGEKGPSFRNSLFHSVLRRSGTGEGLLGGDYEGKAGKGGAAIFGGVQGEEEVAKRCERGMVVRGSPRAEMAAQFCIMVRDGPRNRTVFPFGRVSKGMSVVEEACTRPALTVGVLECGWVLPV
ncbi:hypothetical protein O3P69_018124 [Scylla paramamosain]|uniref:Uncharacterized protein n=2 Tax=Scylla paramamosain TaxID=85552 RepID=A0AAW0TJM9_SCYPA